MANRKFRSVCASAALVVAGLGIAHQAHGQIVVNGTIDAAFGTPLAYDQVPSSANLEAQNNGGYSGAPGSGNSIGFADGTDIEASYATIRANTLGQPTLYMFFSGNLSSGIYFDQTPPGVTGSSPLGDFLNVFIQTGTGGLNTLGGANAFTSDGKYQHMVGTANPITFDSTFSPNYRFALQEVGGTKTGGDAPGSTQASDFNLQGWFGNLNTNKEIAEGNTNAAGGTLYPAHSSDSNGGSAEGINFNINNSNTVGVGSTVASQSAQAAITTGTEIQIPLANLIESGQSLSAGSPIKISYLTMQGNNNPQPYDDGIGNQITNLAPGYTDTTGGVSSTNQTNVSDGLPATGFSGNGDATTNANPGNSNNISDQPGGNHYFTINDVGNLTWNNTGGGNGLTWDAAAKNFNDGASAVAYSDGSLVTFNDSNNSNYNVALNTTVTPGTVTVNSSSTYTISGTGSITGAGAVQTIGTGTLVMGTTNTYTGGTLAAQGTLVVAKNGAIPANSKLTIGTNGFESGMAQFPTSAIVQLAPNTGGLTLSSLNIVPAVSDGSGGYLDNNSTLDITNNHVIINYPAGADPINNIVKLIDTAAFNGLGAGNPIVWTGTGITSSTAAANSGSYGIGYADYADAGNPAGLQSGQIEIMYTLLGDANLDQKVNGADFTLMASNFNDSVSNGWDKGDFDYSNTVNGSDFVLLANNFNQFASQSAVGADDLAALQSFAASNGITLSGGGGGDSVPEPASLGLLAVGTAAMLTRRRRQVSR